MPQWEYLEVGVTPDGWIDSEQREGLLHEIRGPSGTRFLSLAPLCNQLGAQGWELASVVTAAVPAERYSLLFKRRAPEADGG